MSSRGSERAIADEIVRDTCCCARVGDILMAVSMVITQVTANKVIPVNKCL
ncbi:hypothetical protein [Calothrix sp. NIES-3974]|uniref:hypothetical protein n=1 Tax=Calothrix sp. NIES-3974 TaxID=2005462 RepID=UPI0012FD3715|nr:hypothetical protein [Calothrix sp. NIES-3974]